MSEWKPIETAPDDVQPLLVFVPTIHRGRDSCEVVVVLRNEDGTLDFWTNGGANGGTPLHFEAEETPTHWMPLPEPPK